MSLSVMEGTLEYINIVRKHEAIYNVSHPDYKNLEAKSRTWKEVAREAGTTVEACKRKWKNLRDSYTKYLRSFRTGTKTSKKYQYWAHAHHMDFLKPYQGPGRTNGKQDPYENLDNQMHQTTIDDESDLGLQVLKKFAASDQDVGLQQSERHQTDITITNVQQIGNRSEVINLTNYGVENRNEFVQEATAKNTLTGKSMSSQLSVPTQPEHPQPLVQPAPPPPLRISIKPKNATVVRKRVPPMSAEIKKLTKNIDLASIVRANREVDATCLFFLSLAKSVAGLPKKQQIKVKMRCMKIVSEAELDYEKFSQMECKTNENSGKVYYINKSQNQFACNKYTNTNANNYDRNGITLEQNNENSEHFEYVMSPSKVEGLIDISSGDEY